jgi:hypothetical protein
MKSLHILALAGAVALVAALGASPAQAGFGRQYYGGWRSSGQGYYFSTYHYRPSAGASSYLNNYAIWYPSASRYVYYYNPYRKTYWGRFDVQTKGYSLLAEKDRAGRLKDIPEQAFPAEGALPQVPDAKDQLTLAEPPDLPAGEKVNTAAAAPEKTDDLTTPPAVDDKTPPADVPVNKPTPAAPATPAAGGTPAAPSGTPAPAAGAAPVDPPANATPGTGVVAPVEPINPAPVGGGTPVGGAATPAPGGVATPAPGGVGPTADPVFPGFPSGGKLKFGGCHGHRQGW